MVDEAATGTEPLLLEPQKHQLYFKREKRRGKVVTLVGPLHVSPKKSQELLGELKKSLGCGGSFKEEFIELQGEVEVKARPLLEAQGYRFKR